MNEKTDACLLLDYANNKAEDAFGELVSRHIDLVYAAARRLVVDPHLAEDVTQATFAALARQAGQLTGYVVLSGWLHRTACNIASNVVRTEVRRRKREQEACAMQTLQSDPDPDWTSISPLLDAALNQLADFDRTLILLRYFQRKTAREIGNAFQLKEDTAQKRISRATERLRNILARRGVALPASTLAVLLSTHAAIPAPAALAPIVCAGTLAGAFSTIGLPPATTTTVILMSKIKTTTIAALLVGAIAVPFALQQQTIRQLKAENKDLRAASKEVVYAAPVTAPGVPPDSSELLRLRNEVNTLRKENGELVARSAAGRSSPQRPEPPAVPASSWANVGTEEPVSAIQTFLWAGKQGDTNLVRNLLRWRRDAAIPASEELDNQFAGGLVAGATRLARSLESFRVTSQESENENSVRLNVEMVNKEGKPVNHQLRLFREGSQWFTVVHVWKQDGESVRAALDVPAQFKSQ